jgi:hypothetical protein
MPIIKEKVFLNCSPETAFTEISRIDFIKKILIAMVSKTQKSF